MVASAVSTGLFFKLVDDSLGSSAPPKVRVFRITDAPEIRSLIGDVLSTVAVGDELLTVNGVPFDDWYDQNKFSLGFGANDSGGQRGAFQYLEGVSGSFNILPEADDITFQLKRLGGNQAVYTVTVPYVSSSNDECWSLSSNLYKELTGTTLPGTPAPTSLKQSGLFWEMIQDHGIGTVFGDDETTGGGGANVLSSDDDYFTDRPLEYIADPFKANLTEQSSGQKFYTKITVGARQLVRNGNYAGQLVEDNGVKSDVIVRSTIADILPGDGGVSNYDRIANYLNDVAKRKMDSKVYFMSEPYDRATFDDSMNIPFVASGVDEIIVVYQGEQLGKWQGKLSAVRQSRDITIKTPKGLYSHLITFIGKKQGKQMFKTHREIVRISTPNDRVNMMTAKSHTVSGPSSNTGVYNFGSTSEKEGWNFNNGRWILGDSVSDYSGYMYSTVRVWLSAPVGSRISVSLDATVDTYEDRGHFSLDMMDDFGKVVTMLSSTSEDGLTQYKSITGRNRVVKGTYSFTVTTEKFVLGMSFISYSMDAPFSVKINSMVITKD
ncbi:hypothetical protein BASA81_015007 [Batrachochytrium salamandrivorans]|nr:hypothetical protein BASA81_015007 [Batrachochytrium salamandrivorans]